MSTKKLAAKLFFISVLFSFLSYLAGSSSRVHAQSPDEDWALSTNLSNSGGTTAPAIVMDSDGQIHVIWQDYYRGTVYSRFDGIQWSTPQIVYLPFSSPVQGTIPDENTPTGPVPTLLADRSGLVHAFWTDEENQLYHSFVPSASFRDPGAWSGAAQIAESAIDFDATIDDDGRMHLAYVRGLDSPEFPAGIYYRSTAIGGVDWSLPKPIYLSPYFRSSNRTEANVDISSHDGLGGASLVISWDNRLRKQVNFTRSNDDGENWSEPELVDSPTEENPGARPMNMMTVGYLGGLMRFWQDGDPNVNCVQYYQYSSDGGTSWSERQEMLEAISGCPQDLSFFNQDGLLVMVATIQGQVYLLAWDGAQWSTPQLQRELLGFEDPATFDQVIFDCRQPAQDAAGNLLVVGCDTGSGGDIWITQRPIGDVSQWFPLPTAWTDPEQITTADTPITNPILLSDSQGRFHAFWVQKEMPTESASGSGTARDAIYYSRKDAEQWTTPTAILQSPTGMTRQPTVAIDSSDNLLVAWSGGESGEIYFSRATGDRANNPAEWVEPARLPSVRQAGSSPDIVIGRDGKLYVAYAIPLNENRGVYVVNSFDGGATWSEPNLAFDAVQEGWEMVDQPNIAVSEDGTIQLTIAQLYPPGGSGSKGLYAIRSVDDLGNWSDVATLTESPVRWNEVISIGDSLLRAWLETSVGGDFFQYQLSNDQGSGWTTAASISTIGEIVSSPDLSGHGSGQAYLFLPVLDPVQGYVIRSWRWDGSQWKQEDALVLGERDILNLSSVSAETSPSGRLGVAYSASVEDASTKTESDVIDYSDKAVDLPVLVTTSSPEPTLQSTTDNEIASTLLPVSTPTIIPPTQFPFEQNEIPVKTGNTWIGLTIGVVFAGFIAAVAFTFGIIRLKRRP